MPSLFYHICHRQSSFARPPRQRKMIPSLFLFIALLTAATAQICESVIRNSWKGLTDALDRSYGFAILCPFRITGKGCPGDGKSYEVKAFDLYAMCDSVSQSQQESACVIDCPGIHFTVFPSTSLTLDGFTLMGSSSSAIQVKRKGRLTIYNSVFSKYVQPPVQSSQLRVVLIHSTLLVLLSETTGNLEMAERLMPQRAPNSI